MLYRTLKPLSALAAACGAALVLTTASAYAQTPAPAAAAAATSPAKKELVARVLKLQQPGIEAMARQLTEQPAGNMLDRAANFLQARVPTDKQEAVGKEIQADAKKYVDETVPLVQGRALKLAPTTIGAVLEEKFTEDELKQIVAVMESPAYAKYQLAGGELQKALLEKLLADTRPTVEPRLKALEQSISKRLAVYEPSLGKAAPSAKPASK